MKHFALVMLKSMVCVLPELSDLMLVPTRSTDPEVVGLWGDRIGTCHTGIQKGQFHPSNAKTPQGQYWHALKQQHLEESQTQHLLLCISRLSPEKGISELLHSLVNLPNCHLWIVGDGPSRSYYESLCQELQLSQRCTYWGYQTGADLHALYTTADLFVCPSCTETFGQTVNEALASGVRVCLPEVPVFWEAYSKLLPWDSFWVPNDPDKMLDCIQLQLKRIETKDSVGIPDLQKLKSWHEASHELVKEYLKVDVNTLSRSLSLSTLVYLPVWCGITVFSTWFIWGFSKLRSLFGGSVRMFIHSQKEDLHGKIQMIRTNSMNDLESKFQELSSELRNIKEVVKNKKEGLKDNIRHKKEGIHNGLQDGRDLLLNIRKDLRKDFQQVNTTVKQTLERRKEVIRDEVREKVRKVFKGRDRTLSE